MILRRPSTNIKKFVDTTTLTPTLLIGGGTLLKHSDPLSKAAVVATNLPYDFSDLLIKQGKHYDSFLNKLKTELDTLVKEKAGAIQELKMVWGYDYWKPSVMGKSFDEAWDKWGGLVMLGGNLLISLGTGGLASLFTGALSLTVRALIPVVTDIAFNGLIAAYQYNKGEDSQAFLSLVCAFLPMAKFGFNVGKINAEASLRLATKIKATEGLLQDANKLSEFIITLSEEEKYIFRNLMSLPKKQLAEGAQGIFKTLDDVVTAAKKGGTPIGRSSIRAWGPNALRELGIELVPPTVVDVVNQITRFVVDSTIKIQWTPESLKECQSKLKESMDAFIKSDGMLKTFMAIKDVKNDKPLLTLFKNAKTGDQATEIFTTYTRNKINTYRNMTDEQIDRLELVFQKEAEKNLGVSNQLRLSSIPKGQEPFCTITYNKDGYSEHCKDFREYEEWLSKRNLQRWVDVKSHGQQIDGKNMMHCRRLMDMAREIAEGKGIIVRRENANELISIRRGEVDLQTLIDHVESEIIEIDNLFKNSNLPEKVDSELINNLIVRIRKQI